MTDFNELMRTVKEEVADGLDEMDFTVDGSDLLLDRIAENIVNGLPLDYSELTEEGLSDCIRALLKELVMLDAGDPAAIPLRSRLDDARAELKSRREANERGSTRPSTVR